MCLFTVRPYIISISFVGTRAVNHISIDKLSRDIVQETFPWAWDGRADYEGGYVCYYTIAMLRRN